MTVDVYASTLDMRINLCNRGVEFTIRTGRRSLVCKLTATKSWSSFLKVSCNSAKVHCNDKYQDHTHHVGTFISGKPRLILIPKNTWKKYNGILIGAN